jgi:drug/metabolite transporter (DMT)-like permease
MPTSALLLALTAAFVHALWNVLLARARDPQAATAIALLTAEAVFAIPAWAAWRADNAVWPYLIGTGALQLLYFALLVTAYRVAPLSVVYPISRGVAPVLVLVVGVAVLGHATSAGQVVGVLLVGTGILLVRGLRPSVGRGVAFGLAIACVIAAYTLVDKRGVTHAGALPYLEVSMIGPALAYASYVVRVRGSHALRSELKPATFVAGVATSVVVTALLAGRFLAEPVGRLRIAGAAIVAGGIALLSLT